MTRNNLSIELFENIRLIIKKTNNQKTKRVSTRIQNEEVKKTNAGEKNNK